MFKEEYPVVFAMRGAKDGACKSGEPDVAGSFLKYEFRSKVVPRVVKRCEGVRVGHCADGVERGCVFVGRR